eukprot:IDg10391t1
MAIVREKANANRNLTNSTTRVILREAFKHGYFARTLKKILEVPICVRRIQQGLRSFANLSWRRVKQSPSLTPAHKTKRQKWALKHINNSQWEWRNKIFSDERRGGSIMLGENYPGK